MINWLWRFASGSEHHFDVIQQYDEIQIEKVFNPSEAPGYEFYCYKDGVLTKLDFRPG